MTTETTETTGTAPETTTAPDLGTLPLADYEHYRRTGEMPKVEAASAPVEKNEQKKAEASDTSETEADELQAEEKEGDEPTDSKDADGKPKKKSGWQRRIDKLNGRVSAAQQEAEYWKSQALGAKGDNQSNKPVDARKADATGKPKPESFETHAEYVEALAEFVADQKLQERDKVAERKTQEAEFNKTITAHTERVSKFSEKTEDFQDALEAVDHIPAPPHVQQVIVESEHGPELMYELAKNPDQYARICKLPERLAAYELGKIEARIAKTSETKTETKKVTSAPKPLSTVGKAPAKMSKDIADPGISFAEYERIRREQLKRKRA